MSGRSPGRSNDVSFSGRELYRLRLFVGERRLVIELSGGQWWWRGERRVVVAETVGVAADVGAISLASCGSWVTAGDVVTGLLGTSPPGAEVVGGTK